MGTEQRSDCQDHLRARTILEPTSAGQRGHHLGNIRAINNCFSAVISQLPTESCFANLSASCHHRRQDWKPTPHPKVRRIAPARHPHRRHRRIWHCQYLWHGHLGRHSRATREAGGCQALSPQYRGFSTGSGASLKAFKELDADAWITWPEWVVDNPKVLQAIPISNDRTIWRDLNIALSTSADPQAASFLRFLVSDEAQKLMRSAGYVR